MTNPSLTIRPTTRGDLTNLKETAAQAELFPPEALPEMIEPFFQETDPRPIWLSAFEGQTLIGFCFAEQEFLTESTWNMRAIGVAPQSRRSGAGRALMQALLTALEEKAATLLIVDTASSEDLEPAHRFYAAMGYAVEARIRDFWAPGIDKVTFRIPL